MTDSYDTPDNTLKAGDRVRLVETPPYFKTADTMPMLRPPGVVTLGEEGILINYRPGGTWSVRFSKGTFLVDAKYLEEISTSDTSSD